MQADILSVGKTGQLFLGSELKNSLYSTWKVIGPKVPPCTVFARPSDHIPYTLLGTAEKLIGPQGLVNDLQTSLPTPSSRDARGVKVSECFTLWLQRYTSVFNPSKGPYEATLYGPRNVVECRNQSGHSQKQTCLVCIWQESAAL